MKKMKRIMALLLAVMLVLGMSTTAFAAQTGENPEGHTEDVVVDNQGNESIDVSGHTYKAYQIFKGTQAAEDETGKLASIEWGDNVDSEGLLAALKSDPSFDIKSDNGETINAFANVFTAADVADVISKWTEDDNADARAFARCVNAHIKGNGIPVSDKTKVQLDAGYYLIVDETTFGVGETGTAYNLSLLQLTQNGAFVIRNKTDVPSVEKKVQEWNDSEDSDALIPENPDGNWQDAADHDVGDNVPFMLTGTLPSNYDDYAKYKYVFHDTLSAGLTFNEGSVKVFVDGIGSGYTDITDYFKVENGKELTISCNDLKAMEEDGIVLTSDNNIVVYYTAKLNGDAVIGVPGNPNDVYLEYSNNPNWRGSGDNGDDDDDEPTGHTPVDRVIVFTFEVMANKVDEKDNALRGAGFTLYKWIDSEGDWVQIGNEIVVDELDVDGKAKFEFKRIDSGWYKLVESTVPDGYNKADDIEFIVVAEYDEEADEPELTGLAVYRYDGLNEEDEEIFTLVSEGVDAIFSAAFESGIVGTDVVNVSGITLPETGGIGTTIFYVVGGILVVGCGVILLTRKRIRK